MSKFVFVDYLDFDVVLNYPLTCWKVSRLLFWLHHVALPYYHLGLSVKLLIDLSNYVINSFRQSLARGNDFEVLRYAIFEFRCIPSKHQPEELPIWCVGIIKVERQALKLQFEQGPSLVIPDREQCTNCCPVDALKIDEVAEYVRVITVYVMIEFLAINIVPFQDKPDRPNGG